MDVNYLPQDSMRVEIEQTYDHVMDHLYNRYHIHLGNSTRIPTTQQNQIDHAYYETLSSNCTTNSQGSGLTPIGKFVY